MGDCIAKQFELSVIDNSVDGILGVRFVDIVSGFSFCVYSCYLSPENSPWGRNATQFYAHLMSQLYINSDVNVTFICGDFNSRIGTANDININIENLPDRQNVDDTKTGHCVSFLEFIKDTNMCVLNGRLTPEYDNFTSVSTRGRAVVDYIMVPHECYARCQSMHIDLMSSLIARFYLVDLITATSRPSDHSILTCVFETRCYSHTNDNTHSAQDTIKIKLRKKYDFHAPKAVRMSYNTWKLQFSDMTNAIDNFDNQGIIDLDDVYQKLCNIIVTEMDMCLESRNVGSNSHMGRRRNHKPYWSEELTEFWNDMRETERDYLTCHTSREQINVLRRAFIYPQKTFDKKLKQAERAYNRLEIHSIDTLNKSNPKAFWNYVNSLGPRKNSQIPLTVLVNDVPVDDLTSVLEVWRDEFHKLYTKSDDADDNSVGYL